MKKKKIIYYFLSFIIPIALFSIICFISNYYPFGDNLLNKYDSYYQYPSIIMEFINKIKNGESIFYTFHAALGSNFFPNITYYAASPFNLLFLLFNNNNIYLCYAIVIMIKLGLSSFTLFTYFNKKYKNRYSINLIFSIIYSLCTWAICYCFHIMWLDALYLVPLLLIGIDRILEKNNSKMYITILTVAIYINFYTGYMLGIFSIIYFIYSVILYSGSKKLIIQKFIFSTVISILISSVVLIPTGISILNNRGLYANYLAFNINNIKSIFYNLLPGSFISNDNYNNGTALVGSSVLIIILNILFYFNQKISKKEKLVTGAITLFFLLSFSLNLLDYAWQMFNQPIWWNSRYSFLFVLFTIIIGRKSYEYKDKIKLNLKSKNLIILIFFIIFIVSFALKINGTQPKNYILYIFASSVILFIINFCLFTSRLKYKNVILFVLLFIEMILNGIYCLKIDENSYDFNTTSSEMSQNISLVKNIKDKNFYRIYDAKNQQYNGGMMHQYNSTQIFSSNYNKYLNIFYTYYLSSNNKNGTTNSINYNILKYANLEILSLFNVKYILNSNYDLCNKKNICFNKYSLPIAFLFDNNKSPKLDKYNTLSNINKIYSYFLGKQTNLYESINFEPIYTNIKKKGNDLLSLRNITKEGYVEYEFISPIDGIITQENFLDYLNYNVNIIINGVKTKSHIPYIHKNDKVKILFTIPKDSHNINKKLFRVSILNTDTLDKISKILNKEKLEILNDKKNILNGNILVNENNQKLFFSIPYDKGLKVFVDNKEVKINREFNTFISININKGTHNVKIKYISPGFKIGLIITLISIIGTLIVFLKIN